MIPEKFIVPTRCTPIPSAAFTTQVEAHIHENNYAMTFDATLGRAMSDKLVSQEREAKRLAFYIFWNCKSEFERCVESLRASVLPCRSVCYGFRIR